VAASRSLLETSHLDAMEQVTGCQVTDFEDHGELLPLPIAGHGEGHFAILVLARPQSLSPDCSVPSPPRPTYCRMTPQGALALPPGLLVQLKKCKALAMILPKALRRIPWMWRGAVWSFIGFLFGWAALGDCTAAEPTHSFRNEIAPILQARCLRCHSGPHPKGELDLSTRAGMLTGGASGKPAIQPGRAATSLLTRLVSEKKMPPKQPMPASEAQLLRLWIDAGAPWDGAPLAAVSLREQCRAGPEWWSLQPIHRPTVPVVSESSRVRNPIDAFILSRLAERRLSLSPEADRRTLIRRVSLDLTGLLPRPEDIEAFCQDPSPVAYEALVDRLLASPHYGERWGRHWLDVVRFAESHGYETNALRTNAWPYRDYVIRAFNADTPLPRFALEQLASDTLSEGDPLLEAATGFLVGGTHDVVGNATIEGQLQQRMDDLYDIVSTTGSAFLGLTVNCARCHDHKFDPISQRDFYGLQAVFAGVQHAERPMLQPDADQRRREAESVRIELAALDSRIDEFEPLAGEPGSGARPAVVPGRNVERFQPRLARRIRFTIASTIDGLQPCLDELEVFAANGEPRDLALASAGARALASSVLPGNPLHKIEHLNDGEVGNSRSWISNEPGKGWVVIELPCAETINRVVWGRDRRHQFKDRLANDYRVEVSVDGKNWTSVAGSWDRAPYGKLPRPGNMNSSRQKEVEKLASLGKERERLERRLAELERRPMMYAGTFRSPEPTYLLQRGDPLQKLKMVSPSAIAAVAPSLLIEPTAPEAQRRVALARWIGDPRNPLPSRVMVNRLWHYHFGQGLVRTPSDFGFNGDRPSHPELLSWLAAEFQRQDCRLKPLHRLIVLSSTYRQSSRSEPRARSEDGDCRLLWRFPPRRLEAEIIRDTVLQASGSLNCRMGGPGYHLWDYSGYVIVFTPKTTLGPEEFRRMVYQFKPRIRQDETFGAFDCPDATQTMPRRNASTTALQALNMLNASFMEEQGCRFAARLQREARGAPEQIERAFQLALGRPPSLTESTAAMHLVQRHGLAVLCRGLLNANEFVFLN
jgi:hypothetical protein